VIAAEGLVSLVLDRRQLVAGFCLQRQESGDHAPARRIEQQEDRNDTRAPLNN
jgi:hypothetical protein